MAFYRLSPLAESDLEEIWLYTLNQWSLDQANLYYSEIFDAIEALALGHNTGRPVDVRDGYFKYAVGKHFVFFVKTADGINVVRILHQRMDVSRHL